MVNNEPVTQPHVLRMIAEMEELRDRVRKLGDFTVSDEKMNALPAVEQEDLIVQRCLMEDYLEVLERRIDRANGHGHDKPFVPSEIHPAPEEFSAEQLATDPILRYFHYAHLPEGLRKVSSRFGTLAYFIVNHVPRNAERTVALRKLLEAKDAAVRANVQ